MDAAFFWVIGPIINAILSIVLIETPKTGVIGQIEKMESCRLNRTKQYEEIRSQREANPTRVFFDIEKDKCFQKSSINRIVLLDTENVFYIVSLFF